MHCGQNRAKFAIFPTMKDIEIPIANLGARLTRIRDIRSALATPKESRMCGRSELLSVLRKLDAPTETEKKLLADLEKDASLQKNDVDALQNEMYDHFEQVRQLVRDMFVGRYVIYYADKYIMYMYVNKVLMREDTYNLGTVCIQGHEVIMYREFNTLRWTCAVEYPLFSVGKVIYAPNISTSLENAFERFYYSSKEEIVEQLTIRKNEVIKNYDRMIKQAKTMGDLAMPADEPSHPEKWW